MKTNILLRALPALFLLPLVGAKPPGDMQTRLDAWIKGAPGGVAPV